MIPSTLRAISTFNSPTPSLANLYGSMNTLMPLLSRESPECAHISHFRTATNVIFSCMTTIFACTWVSLHPDTPSSKISGPLLRKLVWVIVTLIAPEFIAGKAIHELFQAKQNKKTWNANFVRLCKGSLEIVTEPGKTTKQYERELRHKDFNSHWTLTHGFLAEMGGIRLYNADDKPQIFIPNSKFLGDPKMRPVIQQIGLISTEDIADKCKGDWVSKLFVLTQTTWFIVQCLARWAAGLPVSQLEIATLAYCVQNILIYILWWHKPYRLLVPFRLYLEDSGQVPERGRVGVDTHWVEEMLARGANEDSRMLLSPGHSSRHIVEKGQTETNSGRDIAPVFHPIEVFRLIHCEIGRFLIALLNKHGLPLVLSGTVFGALHFIPTWLCHFPSNTEKTLWHISALYATVAPLGFFLAERLVRIVAGASRSRCSGINGASSGPGIDVVINILFYCIAVPYALARATLLVLMFTTLRMPPRDAFRNIPWTGFIPHF